MIVMTSALYTRTVYRVLSKMATNKETPKKKEASVKKERKPLTLHKHYLVDIRRYAKDLGIDEGDFGKNLDTQIITREG